MPTEPSLEASSLCTFCPSLCHHACPVATAEARDSVSPWGIMSLLHHVDTGRLRLSDEVARMLYACTGCGACTEACVHGNPVSTVLFEARARAVGRGRIAYERALFRHDEDAVHPFWRSGFREREAGKYEPSVLLVPGHRSVLEEPAAAKALLAVCERIDEDELSSGDASTMDVGYDLWAGGFLLEFRTRAHLVREALSRADTVVVLSAEALYCLEHVYPAHGFPIAADLLHASEFVLPLLPGALVERVPGRVAYHDSCHLARHLESHDVPREVLRRCLEEGPIELRLRGRRTACCGGTGCLPLTRPDTALEMARDVVEMALEAGADRLVSFASECVALLREAAGGDLRVDDALAIVDEAVRGEAP